MSRLRLVQVVQHCVNTYLCIRTYVYTIIYTVYYVHTHTRTGDFVVYASARTIGSFERVAVIQRYNKIYNNMYSIIYFFLSHRLAATTGPFEYLQLTVRLEWAPYGVRWLLCISVYAYCLYGNTRHYVLLLCTYGRRCIIVHAFFAVSLVVARFQMPI